MCTVFAIADFEATTCKNSRMVSPDRTCGGVGRAPMVSHRKPHQRAPHNGRELRALLTPVAQSKHARFATRAPRTHHDMRAARTLLRTRQRKAKMATFLRSVPIDPERRSKFLRSIFDAWLRCGHRCDKWVSGGGLKSK